MCALAAECDAGVDRSLIGLDATMVAAPEIAEERVIGIRDLGMLGDDPGIHDFSLYGPGNRPGDRSPGRAPRHRDGHDLKTVGQIAGEFRRSGLWISIVATAEEWKRRDGDAFLGQRLGLVRRGLAPDGALIALAKMDAPRLIGKAAPDIIGLGREIAAKLGQSLLDPSGRAGEQWRLLGAIRAGTRIAGTGDLVGCGRLAPRRCRRGAL